MLLNARRIYQEGVGTRESSWPLRISLNAMGQQTDE